jgi:hypothetical protein
LGIQGFLPILSILDSSSIRGYEQCCGVFKREKYLHPVCNRASPKPITDAYPSIPFISRSRTSRDIIWTRLTMSPGVPFIQIFQSETSYLSTRLFEWSVNETVSFFLGCVHVLGTCHNSVSTFIEITHFWQGQYIPTTTLGFRSVCYLVFQLIA